MDTITKPLGIPWKMLKDIPFSSTSLCWPLMGSRTKTSSTTQHKKREILASPVRMATTGNPHPRRHSQTLWKVAVHMPCHSTRQGVLNKIGKNNGNIPQTPFHASPSSQEPTRRPDMVVRNSLPTLHFETNPWQSFNHRCQRIL